MSDETRRAMDYIVRALAAGVRDSQRETEASETPDLCHLSMILRRMRSDLGALAALLRETQKDAPVRRKRRKRVTHGTPSGTPLSSAQLDESIDIGTRVAPTPRKAIRVRRISSTAPIPATDAATSHAAPIIEETE